MTFRASTGFGARAGDWKRWLRLRYVIPASLLLVACLASWWHLWGRPHAYFLRLASEAEHATVPDDADGFLRSEVREEGFLVAIQWEFSTGMAWQDYCQRASKRLAGAGYELKSEERIGMVFVRTHPGDQTTVAIEWNASSGHVTVRFDAGPW